MLTLFRHGAVSQSCRKVGLKLYFSSHGLNLKGFISTNGCSRCRSGKIVREAGRRSYCSSRSGRTTLASKITLGHKQYFTITPVESALMKIRWVFLRKLAEKNMIDEGCWLVKSKLNTQGKTLTWDAEMCCRGETLSWFSSTSADLRAHFNAALTNLNLTCIPHYFQSHPVRSWNYLIIPEKDNQPDSSFISRIKGSCD